MSEYVYAIVEPSSEPPRGPGIGGSPLRVIAADGAAALVSELREATSLGRDEVLAHAHVLEAALVSGTVLPMRFGTVMDGPDDVRDRLLERHRRELREQLDRLDGKVEMRVRVVYEHERLLREVVREHPEIARLGAALRGRPADATYFARVRLGELIAHAVRDRRERDARAVLDRLERFVEATALAEPDHERIMVDASFLLARARQHDFDAELERIAREQTGLIRVKLSGPVPPHSFVELAGGA